MKTERFHLRKFQDSDLPKVFEGLSHPEVIKYYGVSYSSLEATKEQMKWFADLEENQTGKWFAIRSKATNEFVGAGGFNDWNHQHRKIEIGFWLLPQFWRQGIMTEVMPVLLNFGFETMQLHRIEGFVELENTACRNAIEKLGFEYEGTMRDCEVKNDRFISITIYAKINANEAKASK